MIGSSWVEWAGGATIKGLSGRLPFLFFCPTFFCQTLLRGTRETSKEDEWQKNVGQKNKTNAICF
jgi:hypothetical protein